MNKKRILVIDDEVGFTRMLKLNLEQTNRYEVRVVNVPEDALLVAREFLPDLVLLDVFMPRMSGGDVAAQLRREPFFQNRTIIFFTAAVKKTLVEEHQGIIGGDPFLAKPATLEEVVSTIEKHLPA
jgi:two-component system, OmpR family, response regulator